MPGAGMPRDSAPDQGGSTGWLLASFAMLSMVVASAVLFWLLWSYVPRQMAFCEGLGLELPLLTRIVVALSMWMIRLLPLVVLVGLPVFVVAIALALVWAMRKKAMPRVVRWVAALAFAVALMEILVAGVVVYSFRLALEPPEPAQLSERVHSWSRPMV